MTLQRTHHSKPTILKTQSALKLLAIILLAISTCSLAETSSPVSVLEADTIHVDIKPDTEVESTKLENITPELPSTATSTSFMENNTAIRQELIHIVTSEEYATTKEIKHWEPIERSEEESEVDLGWLEKLLKYIFSDNGNSQDSFAVFSLGLKALLIGALILFIIWVFKRAGYLSGWVGRITKNTGRQSTIHSHSDDYQQQGWEQLPTHEQIPSVVERYLADGKITQAASVFYRGSLRWLVRTQQLDIVSAATENQCLAQIRQLAQFNDSKPHAYISQIISLWVQIAYDDQQRMQNTEELIRQLQINANNWLQQLPPSSHSNTRLNNGDVITDRADNPQQGAR